jgi:Ala-tRNA(Pro) deacylase
MPLNTLKNYLDVNGVRYVGISHSRAYSAQQIAELAHVPGKEMAKTVMIKSDKGLAMAVLPASKTVNFEKLSAGIGGEADLATEREFEDCFPDCEVGAMPPFGGLYGLEVYVDPSLAEDEEIAFNAGSHTELIRLEFSEFERLAAPRFIDFTL